MAEFIDILAQINLDVQGDGDLNKALSAANKQSKQLENQIFGIKKAILETDNNAKKAQLSKELKRAELAANGVRVQTQRIQQELRKADNEAKKAGGTFKKLGAIAGAAFAGFSVLQLGQQMINVTSQFQKFEAVLTNITGDNGEAKRLIEQFTQFAAETPFQVEEVVGAYVRLRNTGIVPTIEEMRKLGDVASASGKDLNQLIEALVDAQVGENERLKEFGIRAEKAGKVTRFTFRGVTTEVQNTSKAINEYIVGLGNVQGVTGANVAIAATLGGQLSNLKDSFSVLLKELGETASPVLTTAISLISKIGQGWVFGIKSLREYIALQNTIADLEGTNTFFDNVADIGRFGGAADIEAGKRVLNSIFGGLNNEQEKELKKFIKNSDAILAQSAEDLNFQAKVEKAIAESAERGANVKGFDFEKIVKVEDLNKLAGEFKKTAQGLGIGSDVIARVLADYRKRLNQLKGVTKAETAATTAATDADIKAAQKRAEAIKDITQGLADAILDQEAKLRQAEVKGAEETLQIIKQLSELEKQEALRRIDDRLRAITEKLNGSVPAAIRAQIEALRRGVDRQFELSLEQDITKFKEKQQAAIIEFENERMAAKAKVKADTAIEIAAQKLRFIEEAQALNDELIAATDIAENEALLSAELLYQQGLLSKQQYEKAKTTATKLNGKVRIDLLIQELEVEKLVQEQIGGDEALKRITAINVALSKLRLQSAELDTTDKKKVALFDMIKLGYTETLSLVQQVNAAIVANETAKINALISLQQKRVDEANRIADEGNAEALEREQARLETLFVQREEAAQRQQRLSLILQASNFALAASEAILAITSAGAQSGIAAPVVIPLVGAALAAGIGFILSLVNSTKGAIQAFKEGTPYVQGQSGIDNVPAMLTKGERVTTVEDNQRYGSIYDYLSNHRPDPARTMELLKGRTINYSGLSGSFEANRRIEAERLLGKAVLEKLTFVNGNLELLVTETVKGNKQTSGVRITNPDELANALSNGNKRWAL